MKTGSFKKVLLLLVLALIIWAACGAVMFAGMAFTSLNVALIVHALAAPVIAAIVSWFYFKRFHYTSPLATAVFFTSVVILMDLFVVAMLVEKSFAMFASILGTWIPFALIFLATYVTGRRLERSAALVT
jgi:hypothetical protein